MNIITQLYRYQVDDTTSNEQKAKIEQRHLELDRCLQVNIQHSFVKKIYVMYEKEFDKEYYENLVSDYKSKIEFIYVGRQAHYKDFLVFVRKNIPDNEVVCFLASDIYINFNLNISFFDNMLPVNTVFGITRHEPTDKDHTICNKDTCCLAHSTGGCGDCFIFRTPMPENIDLEALDHKQNRWGGECNFLHQWYKVGAKVWNPCFQVKTIHLHHNSEYFSQGTTVVYGKPYLPYMEPCPTDSNHCINRPVALYEPGSVWCFRCKAAPNIFCRWQNGGKDWTCSICEMYNEYDKQQGHPGRVPRIGF